MESKTVNGFSLARIGRFDCEYSEHDDRLIVYVRRDDGKIIRVYIDSDGDTHSEPVSGTTFDDPDRDTLFIVVFRPHQRPAWCESYTEAGFLSSYLNGDFSKRCFANTEDRESTTRPTFSEAWDHVATDLNALTRLDNADEVTQYLETTGHNKACSAVRAEAESLGWISHTPN